jgi:hypothetical protein
VDPGKRRKVVLAVLAIVLVVLPLVALSPWGMSVMEDYAIRRSDREWAARMHIGLADVYGWTLQRKSQKAAYGRFLENFQNRPERGYAKYMLAWCMEREHEASRHGSKEAYEDFLDEYAEDPLFQTFPDWQYYVQEAERAIDRLKNL